MELMRTPTPTYETNTHGLERILIECENHMNRMHTPTSAYNKYGTNMNVMLNKYENYVWSHVGVHKI